MLLEPKWMRYSAALSSAVLTKALLIYLGFRLGSWLDAKAKTYPLFMVSGLVLGMGLGIWWILFVAEKRKPK